MSNVLSESEYKDAELFLVLKYGSVDNIINSYIEKENDEADYDMMTKYLSYAPAFKEAFSDAS